MAARTLQNDQPFTALVIRSKNYLGLSIPILINGNTVDIPLDPDAPEYTYFISHGNIELLTELPDFSDELEIYLINTGSVPETTSSQRKDDHPGCVPAFSSIPQSSWREGLPPPNYNRIQTVVEHVVVHHSAGSNTNNDFTQVVRDIYIYHTQVNGWSDIGYNYLVAQDGSIYDGRDPGNLAQDNVLGAHFCGSNSTTMGICLLGNYENAQLTDQNFNSIVDIISWKLEKEHLSPFTKNQHALGYFDAVIGHRDGCATLCPGGNVYARITEIKDHVQSRLDCENPGSAILAFSSSIQVLEPRRTISITNQSSGYDSYEWYFEGGIPEYASWANSGMVNYNYPGTFDVMLIGISENVRDTLIRPDYIEVQGNLVVFPNPIPSNTALALQYHQEILDVKLFTAEGSELHLKPVPESERLVLPMVRPGVYLLKIFTPTEIIGRKILVE